MTHEGVRAYQRQDVYSFSVQDVYSKILDVCSPVYWSFFRPGVNFPLCTACVQLLYQKSTQPVHILLVLFVCLDVYCTTLKTHSIHIGPIQ